MLVVHIQLTVLLYLVELCEVLPYLLSTLDQRKSKTSAVLVCAGVWVCVCETSQCQHY